MHVSSTVMGTGNKTWGKSLDSKGQPQVPGWSRWRRSKSQSQRMAQKHVTFSWLSSGNTGCLRIQVRYFLFSHSHDVGPVQNDKISLRFFQVMQVIQSIFSDYNIVRMTIVSLKYLENLKIGLTSSHLRNQKSNQR